MELLTGLKRYFWMNLTDKLVKTAGKIKRMDFTRPARTKLITKCKFYAVRMMQTGLGKDDTEYTDFKYWKSNGWIDKARPWK